MVPRKICVSLVLLSFYTCLLGMKETTTSSSSSNNSSHVNNTIQHNLTQITPFANYKCKRESNLYDSKKLFTLSRAQIENYLQCKCCFYINRKLGISQPPSFPLNLNLAVDNNLKNEFDNYRKLKQPHPYCVENNINAIPFDHKDLSKWRNSLYKGITYKIPKTNIILQGGIDDIWQDQDTKELIIVDYKATSKENDVSIDAPWQDSYKRQMCIYQYLFRKNGFNVSNTGYFVYANAKAGNNTFDNKLDFVTKILPYQGDDSWVESTVKEAYECLKSNVTPTPSLDCNMCKYITYRNEILAQNQNK